MSLRDAHISEFTPIEDAFNAGLEFWDWYDGQAKNSNLDRSQVRAVAADTIALHLPESMMDKRTMGTLVTGTRFIAGRTNGQIRQQVFNQLLVELSADPTTQFDEISPEIFKDEYLAEAKIVMYTLARMVVTGKGNHSKSN